MTRPQVFSVFTLLSITLSGCFSTAPVTLPNYTVNQVRYEPSPPPPINSETGVASSAVTVDPVEIEPETVVGYDNLPENIQQLYSTDPVELSLNELIVQTLSHNRTISIEGYNLRLAEYQVPISKAIYDLLLGAQAGFSRTEEQQLSSLDFRGLGVQSGRSRFGQLSLSQLLPTGAVVSLFYNVARNTVLSTDLSGGLGGTISASNRVFFTQRTTLEVNQPLLRGFGPTITNAGIRIAQLARQGAAADFQVSVEDTIQLVLQTYWDLIGAIELYKVRVINYALAADLLRVNRAKFEAGVLPKTDVLQAEAAVEARREQIIVARQRVRDLEDELKRLVFLQSDTPMWEAEIAPTQPFAWREIEVDQARAIQVAHDRRAELRSTQSLIDQAEVNLKVATDNLQPQLDLFGSVDSNGLGDNFDSSWDYMGDAKFTNYTIGLSFEYPLQNRAARYGLRQAEATYAQATEGKMSQTELITLEVRRAIRALRSARERIEVTQAQVRAAEATLDAEMKRYDVGISTAFEVLDFQEDLADAQQQHLVAVVEYNVAAIQLERARGTLLETYGILIEGAELTPEVEPVIFPVGLH